MITLVKTKVPTSIQTPFLTSQTCSTIESPPTRTLQARTTMFYHFFVCLKVLNNSVSTPQNPNGSELRVHSEF